MTPTALSAVSPAMVSDRHDEGRAQHGEKRPETGRARVGAFAREASELALGRDVASFPDVDGDRDGEQDGQSSDSTIASVSNQPAMSIPQASSSAPIATIVMIVETARRNTGRYRATRISPVGKPAR